jgi:hypothetical protein
MNIGSRSGSSRSTRSGSLCPMLHQRPRAAPPLQHADERLLCEFLCLEPVPRREPYGSVQLVPLLLEERLEGHGRRRLMRVDRFRTEPCRLTHLA